MNPNEEQEKAQEIAANFFKSLNRAEVLMEVERWREAIVELGNHLARFPDSYHALCKTSFCHVQLKEYQKAYDITKLAIASSPENEWAYRLQSVIFTRNGEGKKALDAAKMAVEKAPGEYLPLLQLFWAQSNYGALDDAEATVKLLAKVMPGASEIHDASGYLALKREKYLDAEKHFLEALKIDPENVEALNNLGVAYLELAKRGKGRHYQKKAVELFERSVKLQPTFKLGQQNISTASNAIKIGFPIGGILIAWSLVRILGSLGQYLSGSFSKSTSPPRRSSAPVLNLSPVTSSSLLTAVNIWFLVIMIGVIVAAVFCISRNYREIILYNFVGIKGWLITSALFGSVFALFVFCFRTSESSIDTTPAFSGVAFVATSVILFFSAVNLIRKWKNNRL